MAKYEVRKINPGEYPLFLEHVRAVSQRPELFRYLREGLGEVTRDVAESLKPPKEQHGHEPMHWGVFLDSKPVAIATARYHPTASQGEILNILRFGPSNKNVTAKLRKARAASILALFERGAESVSGNVYPGLVTRDYYLHPDLMTIRDRYHRVVAKGKYDQDEETMEYSRYRPRG